MKRRADLIVRLAKSKLKLQGDCHDVWNVLEAEEKRDFVSTWVQNIPEPAPVSENDLLPDGESEYIELLPATSVMVASTSKSEEVPGTILPDACKAINETPGKSPETSLMAEEESMYKYAQALYPTPDRFMIPAPMSMPQAIGSSSSSNSMTPCTGTDYVDYHGENATCSLEPKQQETDNVVTDNLNFVQTAETEKKTDTLQPELKKTKRNKVNRRKLNKQLMHEGKCYETRDNKIKMARSIKPGCGEKCKLQCSQKISDEIRSKLFKNYWSMGNLQRKREYIKDSVEKVITKYPRVALNKKRDRGLNYSYHFLVDGEKIRVCQAFFMSTFHISARVIQTVRQKTNVETVILENDKRGFSSINCKKVPPQITNSIVRHIESLPRVESHYCRKKSTCVYIDGGKSLADLHRDYINDQKNLNEPGGTYDQYRDVFSQYNLKFFKPKKDQCEDCVAYELLPNKKKEEVMKKHADHLEQKELAREDKNKDKSNTPPTTVVCCYDLQAVMNCPQDEASPFYYVSKLGVYNFTVVDLKTGKTSCFVWDETQDKRGATEVGSCVYKYLKNLNETSPHQKLDIIFYSDNCCGQHKNQYLQSIYHYAVKTFSKIDTISHKFLIKGHTQNEGDAIHSIIEKNVSKALRCAPVYHPSQYVQLIRTAKKKNPPLKVVEMSHLDFLNVKDLKSGPKLKMQKGSCHVF